MLFLGLTLISCGNKDEEGEVSGDFFSNHGNKIWSSAVVSSSFTTYLKIEDNNGKEGLAFLTLAYDNLYQQVPFEDFNYTNYEDIPNCGEYVMGAMTEIVGGPANEDICLTTIYTITSNTPNSLSFSVSFGLGDLECRGNPVEIGIITLSIEDSKLRQSVSENSLVRLLSPGYLSYPERVWDVLYLDEIANIPICSNYPVSYY